MFTVKRRVYGKAADGRTILLYAPGMTISDDAAKAAGLLAGAPSQDEARQGPDHQGSPSRSTTPRIPRRRSRA